MQIEEAERRDKGAGSQIGDESGSGLAMITVTNPPTLLSAELHIQRTPLHIPDHVCAHLNTAQYSRLC